MPRSKNPKAIRDEITRFDDPAHRSAAAVFMWSARREQPRTRPCQIRPRV